jgi:hypothetical protein
MVRTASYNYRCHVIFFSNWGDFCALCYWNLPNEHLFDSTEAAEMCSCCWHQADGVWLPEDFHLDVALTPFGNICLGQEVFVFGMGE